MRVGSIVAVPRPFHRIAGLQCRLGNALASSGCAQIGRDLCRNNIGGGRLGALARLPERDRVACERVIARLRLGILAWIVLAFPQ